jgi:hypothetical protein
VAKSNLQSASLLNLHAISFEWVGKGGRGEEREGGMGGSEDTQGSRRSPSRR